MSSSEEEPRPKSLKRSLNDTNEEPVSDGDEIDVDALVTKLFESKSNANVLCELLTLLQVKK